MTSIKRDDNKQKWEETEFPLVCETCLGDNPYIRMTKEPHGKKCKICEIPFTVFAWQAGTKGRLKKVEICQTCAKTKNVCQVCIFDLQYGLPVKLRDKVLRECGGTVGSAGAGAGAGAAGCVVVPPQSDANLSWFTQSQARALENGTHGAPVPTEADIKLQKMARMEPRYERNLAKLCTFFARGECNRGNNCPFRHEMPKDRNDPLSKQNTKDRFYGTHDPVAEKMIHLAKERAEKRKAEAMARDGENEDAGEGTTTILGTTLYCRFGDGSNTASITEHLIRDKFYSFGEISSIRFGKDRTCVFVEYTSKSATQLAITTMDKTIIAGGSPCYVSWARAPKRGNGKESTSLPTTNTINRPIRPIRPILAPGATNGLPKLRPGFASLKPSKEVLAAAAAKQNTGPNTLSSSRLRLGVPRPGGGVIRGPTRMHTALSNSKPYYPSQNPGRLGSHANK